MVAVFATASAMAGGALAAGGSPDPMPAWPTDPKIDRVSALTAKNDWTGAAAVMKEAIATSPQNAEYHNMYAYTVRKGPNPDMDLVFKHYNEALRLKPDYRGAHEYIGEAYLMVNNLPKAKEHLARLDRLCTFGCEEYTDLKKAVAAYEAQKR
jgi:tetratricopeptide (TPR) repeat protein